MFADANYGIFYADVRFSRYNHLNLDNNLARVVLKFLKKHGRELLKIQQRKLKLSYINLAPSKFLSLRPYEVFFISIYRSRLLD